MKTIIIPHVGQNSPSAAIIHVGEGRLVPMTPHTDSLNLDETAAAAKQNSKAASAGG